MESPQTLLREIYAKHDLSETQIVTELAELGVHTSQPTINRIRRGVAGDTKGELALLDALQRLRVKLRGTPTPPIPASRRSAQRAERA